ncbi:MAG: hypothetical protein MJ151_01875, partial [Lachnospiraceae bacterium]|nr:hypothetical protein [Lachnospiraceae bacterium]
MTIKTKLQSFGIDCDKDKKAVTLAKKILADNGIKSDKVSIKIDADGERLLEEAFKDTIESTAKKKSIKAPTTKKSSDDESISTLDVINKEKELKKDIEEKIEAIKEENVESE